MTAETAGGRELALTDGNVIPMLGLGVWQARNGTECVNAVRWALELGYRHIDTAQDYKNEESVGRALQASSLPRDEVYVTTKFQPGQQDPVAELEHSLRRLGLDYVDLYLVHWPQGGPTWAWPRMERARELGYTRSIGVSNFDVRELDEVLAVASSPPVVNQVQFSPFTDRRALRDAGLDRGIVTEAYSPLGTGRLLKDKTIRGVAERIGRTPAQVLIRWALGRGLVVLPKSTHRERIEENAQVFDFTLSAADLAELDGLDRTGGTDQAQEHKWW